MADPAIHQIALTILTVTSLASLLLLVLKALGKEVEDAAVIWIRVWKRIRDEHKKQK